MEVEIVESRSISQAQKAAWEHLFESDSHARFYQHPHWHLSIAKHLSPSSVDFVFLSIDGSLTLVLPLCGSASKGRCAHPTHDHLSLNDLLISPTLKQDTNLLLQALRFALDESVNRWSDWQVSNVPHDSALVEALAKIDAGLNKPNAKAHTINFRATNSNAAGNWFVNQTRYSANFDCSSENCPPTGKLKRNLRRLRKKLEEQGNIKVETATDSDALVKAYEEFLTVEASGWKGTDKNASAINTDESLTEFYRSLLTENVSNLHPEINLLWCDDNCLAAQFGLRTNNCLSLLKIGYNEDFAQYSPGYLLLESVLEQTAARNIDTLSLVTSPPWAERWHPHSIPVWHIGYYSRSTRGIALHQLKRLKQAAKMRIKKAA